MKYINHPYFSDKIKHPKTVYRKFRLHRFMPNIYVIRTALDPDELEIIKADLYKQKYIRREDKYIVGFASGYDDACEMVIKLTQAAIDELGKPAIKEYIFK